MAKNETGIAIVIKAFLPTGKSLDENFNALYLVKSAHETGDYSALLAKATVEDVKTEQKTRRVEDPAPQPKIEDGGGSVTTTPTLDEGGKPAALTEAPSEPAPATAQEQATGRRAPGKAAVAAE